MVTGFELALPPSWLATAKQKMVDKTSGGRRQIGVSALMHRFNTCISSSRL
jgi:hypothetical protein